jgi:hypothetical protein
MKGFDETEAMILRSTDQRAIQTLQALSVTVNDAIHRLASRGILTLSRCRTCGYNHVPNPGPQYRLAVAILTAESSHDYGVSR